MAIPERPPGKKRRPPLTRDQIDQIADRAQGKKPKKKVDPEFKHPNQTPLSWHPVDLEVPVIAAHQVIEEIIEIPAVSFEPIKVLEEPISVSFPKDEAKEAFVEFWKTKQPKPTLDKNGYLLNTGYSPSRVSEIGRLPAPRDYLSWNEPGRSGLSGLTLDKLSFDKKPFPEIIKRYDRKFGRQTLDLKDGQTKNTMLKQVGIKVGNSGEILDGETDESLLFALEEIQILLEQQMSFERRAFSSSLNIRQGIIRTDKSPSVFPIKTKDNKIALLSVNWEPSGWDEASWSIGVEFFDGGVSIQQNSFTIFTRA